LNHHKIPLIHYKIPLNHYKIPLNHYKIPLNHYKEGSSSCVSHQAEDVEITEEALQNSLRAMSAVLQAGCDFKGPLVR
jgi:hypothetical protein